MGAFGGQDFSGFCQVVVFDLEYGQPAASTTLPTARPAFRDFLGCFGHADVGKGLTESGVDLLYTSHQVSRSSVLSQMCARPTANILVTPLVSIKCLSAAGVEHLLLFHAVCWDTAQQQT
jgi:hypothetical protein